MRIAIFGSGGVGAYFGGRLARAGHSVAFVARGAHLQALRADGLTVDSVAGDFTVQPVEATSDPREIGPVDAVLVGVKAWQVRETAEALGPLLGPDTFVVPLQNGVEAADELGEVIGRGRVLGGLCRIMSFVAGPDASRTRIVPRIEFGQPGRRSSWWSKPARRVRASGRAPAAALPDIAVALWEKFLFIAPVSAVGAVTRMPAGVFRAVPETRAILAQSMGEILAVAHARGVALPSNAVAKTLAIVDGLPAEGTASMQRDILEGRPSELEYQVGAVVRLSAQVGLAAPASTFLYASLLPAERRARAWRPDANAPPG